MSNLHGSGQKLETLTHVHPKESKNKRQIKENLIFIIFLKYDFNPILPFLNALGMLLLKCLKVRWMARDSIVPKRHCSV